MRLINIHNLSLSDYVSSPPPYIILSHRWLEDELTYKDFVKGRRKDSIGFLKISDFCNFVRREQLMDQDSNSKYWFRWQQWGNASGHFGNDSPAPVHWLTRCVSRTRLCSIYSSTDKAGIDKRSSAELSEAINSMWQWYQDAERCIAFLSDVEATNSVLEKWSQFNGSNWFKRGWTLQELLAPGIVTFCNSSWSIIGTLAPEGRGRTTGIVQHVSLASGIEESYLHGKNITFRFKNIMDACVAKKFNWAARLKTTRPEDLAYCLLGLLNVNMPLLYGEGGHKAFIRLQQEIIRQSDDESLFAWQRKALLDEPFGLLAPDISFFSKTLRAEAIAAVEDEHEQRPPYSVTNEGVQLETRAYEVDSAPSSDSASGPDSDAELDDAGLQPSVPSIVFQRYASPEVVMATDDNANPTITATSQGPENDPVKLAARRILNFNRASRRDGETGY